MSHLATTRITSSKVLLSSGFHHRQQICLHSFFSKLLLFFQILPSLKLLMELQKWEEESERVRLSLGQSPQSVEASLGP